MSPVCCLILQTVCRFFFLASWGQQKSSLISQYNELVNIVYLHINQLLIFVSPYKFKSNRFFSVLEISTSTVQQITSEVCHLELSR